MSTLDEIKKIVNEHDIKYISLRFTGITGIWHSFIFNADFILDQLEDGLGFDGSSIPGWKAINESDMKMMPDLSTSFVDPYASRPTLVIICDIMEPCEKEGYNRDPRSIAKKAERYLKSTNIANTAYFGPEPEFFIFDDVKFQSGQYNSFYQLDSLELPHNSAKSYVSNNAGYRCHPKGGYLVPQPHDIYAELRAEMAEHLGMVGITVNLNHHEVSPCQSEIGFQFESLLKSADNLQKLKYVIHSVAASYGKSVTFMPKPIYGENGSGMHLHQSLWQGNKNLFAGSNYASLSDTALYYIGGIIKHGKAINAFTNPTTNSYKRLVPGYEAPVSLVYSACNRSASIRIPYSGSEKARRIETRFPDPTANPYLAFAAMVMAGIDGIQNKIHPGEAIDENLYELSKERLDKIPSLAHSLCDALKNLQDHHEFLLRGNVFTEDFIKTYISLKMKEIEKVNQQPHPIEFEMYF